MTNKTRQVFRLFERSDQAFVTGLCKGLLGLGCYAGCNYIVVVIAMGNDALRGFPWLLAAGFGCVSLVAIGANAKLRSELADRRR
jgi:hypothetical protein